MNGTFQAAAVRAASFAIVSLSALAPAVKCVGQLIATKPVYLVRCIGPIRNYDVYHQHL